ncbi:MAG: NERD domain-containing protein [Clostridiales bacterium]|nr:NERD domain-containing protein [Clostridiales bacterium]
MAIFSRSGARSEILEGTVFTKPYADKGNEIKALSEKLEEAPPQSKFIFREALELIRKKERANEAVYKILKECAQPALVLHNVNVASRSGATRIDFVVLTPGYLLAIHCREPRKEGRFTAENDLSPSDTPHIDIVDGEETAHILAESLRESGRVSPKMIRNIWPVTIVSQDSVDRGISTRAECFSSTFSRVFPEVRSTQIITEEELVGLMKALAGPDNASFVIPPKKMYAISDFLIEYDSSVAGCPVPYRPKTG